MKNKAYLIRLGLEKIIFWGLRWLAFPLWLRFLTAQPAGQPLDYETLLALNAKHPRAPKPPGEADTEHQKKWAQRVIRIAEIFGSNQILEVGCGYGFASLFVSQSGKQVSAVDVEDVRYPAVKESGVKFSVGDACQRLPFRDNSFDLIYSINAVEHFPDPEKAISEIIRVTRPGGIIFLAFSQLYYSAWGLHASRRLGMPYPQLLFSEETIQRFVDEKQAEIADTYSQSSDRSKIGPYLNGYSIQQYRAIFRGLRRKVRTWLYSEMVILDGSKIIWTYPGLIKKRVPSFDDLIVGGIKFVAQKKA